MFTVTQTKVFQDWHRSLTDRIAQKRIAARILRMEGGNLGDVKPVGEGVSEARIQHGPGYRLYFVTRNRKVIVLLCGGDKGTQSKDIEQAKALAKELQKDDC